MRSPRWCSPRSISDRVGRQPLYLLGAGARSQVGQDKVALPVLAEQSVRLRCGRRDGARHDRYPIGSGDNLYTCSVLALDPKSGKIKWHYQFSPNNPFDYDAVAEMVLATIDIRSGRATTSIPARCWRSIPSRAR